jgi:periodic tryptophan protein 1
LEILPSDNCLVTAKTQDEISQLEIYVYDESQDSLYVHHDIMLPSFPLCLEWLDFHPAGHTSNSSSTGSYVAVGTMEPEIEIWCLDTLEAIYPASVLGRPDLSQKHTPIPLGTGKKKRKKTKSRSVCATHHVDAVLGLAWNKNHPNLLASASADTTVKLWDLTRPSGGDGDGESGGALRSFQTHKDKVQSVQWNNTEPTVLLTGSYDRTVRTFDSRAPEKGLVAILGADVEALRWDPWENHSFYVCFIVIYSIFCPSSVYYTGLFGEWVGAEL